MGEARHTHAHTRPPIPYAVSSDNQTWDPFSPDTNHPPSLPVGVPRSSVLTPQVRHG
ncbi:hypothetical protein CABS01_16001 [Colletotrichum abscissum]|uniref:uncharacterized protein n=1 Tax=Colletotrichum abscissum TaxID=1671311 RepID=UPI0027D4C037|nr:uncharacterized protein CABS01_16001 [Colletotrichum abscissum]KAK1474022.1 hypothetical protein CABS01_16001 [Colletotrichum abscissum]